MDKIPLLIKGRPWQALSPLDIPFSWVDRPFALAHDDCLAWCRNLSLVVDQASIVLQRCRIRKWTRSSYFTWMAICGALEASPSLWSHRIMAWTMWNWHSLMHALGNAVDTYISYVSFFHNTTLSPLRMACNSARHLSIIHFGTCHPFSSSSPEIHRISCLSASFVWTMVLGSAKHYAWILQMFTCFPTLHTLCNCLSSLVHTSFRCFKIFIQGLFLDISRQQNRSYKVIHCQWVVHSMKIHLSWFTRYQMTILIYSNEECHCRSVLTFILPAGIGSHTITCAM